MTSVDWQPTLTGPLLRLRSLAMADFEALYAAASDPLIWAQHPERDRFRREVFQGYFDSAIACGGALAILDAANPRIIGSSRFYNYNAEASAIEIGYTFLERRYWGGAYNRQLKELMLAHAFRFVRHCELVVGVDNMRSRAAVRKIGGMQIAPSDALVRDIDPIKQVVYRITKP